MKIAIIPARKNSKRIKNKNIKNFYGKPIISYAIKYAKESKLFDRIIVSSDSKKIIKIAKNFGAEAPFVRPKKFSTDKASHSDTIFHALEWLYKNEGYNPGQIMLLQPTSPLRSIEDIHQSIIKLRTSKASSLVSVTESHHHPYLMNKIIDNRLIPFVPTGNFPGMESIRRQELPGAYFVNGAIYI